MEGGDIRYRSEKKRCCIWFEAEVNGTNSCYSSLMMCDGSLKVIIYVS